MIDVQRNVFRHGVIAGELQMQRLLTGFVLKRPTAENRFARLQGFGAMLESKLVKILQRPRAVGEPLQVEIVLGVF